jgi:hypothetical protein
MLKMVYSDKHTSLFLPRDSLAFKNFVAWTTSNLPMVELNVVSSRLWYGGSSLSQVRLDPAYSWAKNALLFLLPNP